MRRRRRRAPRSRARGRWTTQVHRLPDDADIEELKPINDLQGHFAHDKAFRGVAELSADSLKTRRSALETERESARRLAVQPDAVET